MMRILFHFGRPTTVSFMPNDQKARAQASAVISIDFEKETVTIEKTRYNDVNIADVIICYAYMEHR